LILSFALMLLFPTMLIGWMSYQSAKQEVDRQFTRGAFEQVNVLNKTIDSYLRLEMQEVERIADKIVARDLKPGDSAALALFADFLRHHPEMENGFVGTETGLFVSHRPNKNKFDPRTRPWYQQAMERKGQTVVSDPYLSNVSGNVVVAVARSTKDGAGVVAFSLNLESLGRIVSSVKIGEEGYVYILDRNRTYIVHPTEEAGSKAEAAYLDSLYASQSGTFEYVYKDGSAKKMSFTTNETTGWKLGGTFYLKEIDAAALPILRKTLMVLAVSVLAGAAIILLIVRSITKPLQKLMTVSKKISEGDLTVSAAIDRRDELGQLAKSFDEMRQSLRNILDEVNQSANHLAASAEELMASAEQSTKASEQISSTIQEVAQGTEQQVQSVESGYQVVNEMAASAQQITSNAQHVSTAAQEASSRAEAGNQAVEVAIRQMKAISETVNGLARAVQGLGERSHQIGKILDVITDIANQTNLLALNAAIEAARAGEYGRGFAVVADEVRKLAEQTSHSTQQIAELVASIQQETDKTVQSMETATREVTEGIDVVNTAGESFAEIKRSIAEVALQIQELTAAVAQLSSGASHMVESTRVIREVAEVSASGTQSVSAAVQEQLASMEEISASATALAKMAEELQELVGKFKA
jgi:methyl-accepting chemotaxis protein